MTIRQPLVLASDGLTQQLQPGDTLATSVQVDQFGQQLVRLPLSTVADASLSELIAQTNAILYAVLDRLCQITAINRGLQGPQPDEEPDALISAYRDNRNDVLSAIN